ncbi:PepSY domain-containing protein [Aquabacterium sp. OR-4]|uniref:PepSY domain-containing protein n=1 Tax=Aquabacterium sp. OR-4 TaxID=2978127 RepID=UPI0021B3FC8E|nr:PepSY domain-containing protein [Aquabacterium sp. OR-4]MDT7834288.1 PepSY domain-containing protein [Aquabacterium sp. OR-4]
MTRTPMLRAAAPLLLLTLATWLLLVPLGARAHGDVKCAPVPKAEWRPHTELERKLTGEGWVVRRMVATDTCYEVYAKDPQGKRIEAFFHPKTFERVDPK